MKLAPGNAVVNDFVGVIDADHSEFLAHLPDAEPRFAFYEVVDNGEKPFRMPIFIFWCERSNTVVSLVRLLLTCPPSRNPDNAPMSQRRYAMAAKPTVLSNLSESRLEILATTKDELRWDAQEACSACVNSDYLSS